MPFSTSDAGVVEQEQARVEQRGDRVWAVHENVLRGKVPAAGAYESGGAARRAC